MFISQVRVEHLRRSRAAVKLQAMFRGSQGRLAAVVLRQQRELEARQRELQAIEEEARRAAEAREELERVRQRTHDAACKIQTLFRCHQALQEMQLLKQVVLHAQREELKQQNHAATRIQAVVRGHQARGLIGQLRDQQRQRQNHGATEEDNLSQTGESEAQVALCLRVCVFLSFYCGKI
jgi:hypothetical protein